MPARPNADDRFVPMRVLLTAAGERVNLSANRAYLIGRDPDCDIVASDRACSRRHAKITVAADGKSVHVEDLASSNGTYVNNERIGEPTLLKLGSRISIGASLYVLSLASVRSTKQLDVMNAGTLTLDLDGLRELADAEDDDE